MNRRGARRIGSVLVLTLVAVLGAMPGTAAAEAITGSYWYAVDHITKVAEDGRIVLWIVLPPERPEQGFRVTGIHPEPVAVLEDAESGNRVVEWMARPEAAAGPSASFFHFDFEFEEKSLRFDVDPGAVRKYDVGSIEYRRYTGPEFWVQTDGPILDQARTIVGDQKNPYLQANLFFDWLADNMEFVPGGEGERDAVSTLRIRRGDCGQYSLLFVALCRSVGIPARTVASKYTSGGSHIHAEILLPGYGWVPYDVSLGQMLLPGGGGLSVQEVKQFMAERGVPLGDARWLAGNLFDGRIITGVGNNIRFESPTLGREITLQQMNPGGIDAVPEGFRIDGLNRDIIHGGFFVLGRDVADEEEAHVLTHQYLASSFFRVGLYDVVEDACRKTQEASVEGIQSWINMGKVYMHKGEYYRAEAAFKRAMNGMATDRREKLDSVIWTHNYLGNCYDLLDHREMARAEYQQVVDLGNNYRGAVEYAKRYLKKPFDKTAPAEKN